MTSLTEFNQLDAGQAAALVRPCLDVDRWVEALVAGRPYDDLDALTVAAETVATPFTETEVEAALAHHPRIGERATGGSAEAGLSRSEQAGLAVDDEVAARLTAGNRAYEERFDRVFLIRAAGRSSAEILDALEQRLAHDDDTEEAVVADQLRQIAVLRLAGQVKP